MNKVETAKNFPEIYSLLTQIHDLFLEYVLETSEDEEDLFYTDSSSSEHSRSSTPPIDIIYPEIKLNRAKKAIPSHDNFEHFLEQQKKYNQVKIDSMYS